MKKRDFKLGLALAGGGVRGFAQIPVLRVLQENGIEPDFVSGTSIGSIMASLYAIGLPADEIESVCKRTVEELIEKKVFTRPNPMFLAPTKNKLNGMVNGDKVEEILLGIFEKYGIKNILDVRMPIVIVSVDIATKKIVYFTNVWDFCPSRDAVVINDISLASAVRSSCSYPGVVAANCIGDMMLCDGGLMMNLPVEPLRDLGADKVLSLSMTKGRNVVNTRSAIKTAKRSVDAVFEELMNLQIRSSDLNIDLQVGDIAAFDLTKSDEIYNKGVAYAEKYRDDIIAFCAPVAQEDSELQPSEHSAEKPVGIFARLKNRFGKKKQTEPVSVA